MIDVLLVCVLILLVAPSWVHSEVFHFACYYVASNAIGAMPAPTASDGKFYVWLFRFGNGVASNLSRAFSTQIEKSPNWADALAKVNPQQEK